MTRTKKAFTLVELLVVISIIALLVSILMPALNKAREMGKRAVCLSNEHQLGLSWMLYSEDADGKLVNGNTGTIAEGDGHAVARRQDGWVGWVGTTVIPPYSQTPEEQLDEIEEGALFPYTNTPDVYRCPIGKNKEMRTYAIADGMNGWNPSEFIPSLLPRPISKTLSKIKRASERIVFVDAFEQSVGSWSQVDHSPVWFEPVSSRHANGAPFGFADGHSEYWKWTHEQTIDIGKLTIEQYFYDVTNQTWTVANEPGNGDLARVQRGVWGKLNYTP